MEITEFIKKELKGWKEIEIALLLLSFVLIFYNAVVLKDSIIAVCSAFCGILYTMIAGKGKISCYFFGLIGSFCYIWLSISNHLWGNALLYLTYYIPMQIFGIFSWKKNLKRESAEIIKTQLNFNKRLKFFMLCIVGAFITILILNILNDKSPVIDGITTFLSVIGMYFTVKRLLEQWIIWIIVNGLSFLMWLNIILNGTKAMSTLVMWGVYFILAIYFYFTWEKEIKTKLPCQ